MQFWCSCWEVPPTFLLVFLVKWILFTGSVKSIMQEAKYLPDSELVYFGKMKLHFLLSQPEGCRYFSTTHNTCITLVSLPNISLTVLAPHSDLFYLSASDRGRGKFSGFLFSSNLHTTHVLFFFYKKTNTTDWQEKENTGQNSPVEFIQPLTVAFQYAAKFPSSQNVDG